MTNFWDGLKIYFTEPVRDPLWKNILFPHEFESILFSHDFIKLSRIMQLGPAHLVYPGATHTRRAHSIGVFEMAKRTLSALAAHTEPSGFSIRSLERKQVVSFLVAALCHDVGHFPYAHSLKELPLKEHEALTAELIQTSLKKAVIDAGADADFTAAIVDESLPSCGDPQALELFRALLSGVLDPDKLDYLNRDAWACGVPYGTQDVDFILQHLTLGNTCKPAIYAQGVMAIEAVLFSKYQMYKAVYWHKSVRAATAMIKKAVILALNEKLVSDTDLYGLSDDEFYTLMLERKTSNTALIQDVFKGKLYRLCYETGYDSSNPMHTRISKLETRATVEKELAQLLAVSDIVLDLPEPISFESKLPIISNSNDFFCSKSVFNFDSTASFTDSLRLLRVYVKPSHYEKHGNRLAMLLKDVL